MQQQQFPTVTATGTRTALSVGWHRNQIQLGQTCTYFTVLFRNLSFPYSLFFWIYSQKFIQDIELIGANVELASIDNNGAYGLPGQKMPCRTIVLRGLELVEVTNRIILVRQISEYRIMIHMLSAQFPFVQPFSLR